MRNSFKALSLLCAASVVGGLSSCSDESPWAGSDYSGGINLEFSADGRVMRQSRSDADDNVSPVVPKAEQFAVNLKSADGSYSKDWVSIDSFNHEASFPIGDYTLSAFYGDMEQEGFEKPYFYGETAVHVSPSAESQAHIVATLANAMVSIRYTDRFKENFQAYSAAAQSEGHDWIVYAQDENRPVYISPSDVKLNLTLTDSEGRQVTIQPAGFNALARHHYIVTFDVDGTAGDLKLNVIFEENVESESVEVSLGDDLFTSPAPEVRPKGFADGDVIDGFEYLTQLPEAEFQVFAFGGLKEATLTVVTDNGYSPSFGRSVQLVNAPSLTQSQLANDGVKCTGFFKNVEKLGVVNISDFLKSLPVGNYTIELEAKDAMTRVSAPVKLSMNLRKVDFQFGAPTSVVFGSTEISVDINTNCEQLKDNLKFRAPDSSNRMVDVKVKEVKEIQPAGSLGHTYRFVLSVAPQNGSEVDVEAEFAGNIIYTTLPVIVPEYNVESDGFARHVVIRVSSESSDAQAIIDNLQFLNFGEEVPKQNVSYDRNNHTVTIIGLNPGVTYENMSVKFGDSEKEIPAFTTETEVALTNGDFSASSENIDIKSINVGGKFKISFGIFPSTSQTTSSILRSLPDNWATLNQLTCFQGSSNKNTWYMEPSTWVEDGQIIIQSMGYHHSGESLATTEDKSSFLETTYYCTSVPQSLMKSTGELFLGSYPLSSSQTTRTDGIEWSTRPASLSFDYKYESRNGEQAEAYISILGDNNEVLASKTVYLDASADMKRFTVSLTGYKFGKKARSIRLGFKSTKSGVEPDLFIPTGSELYEPEITSSNYLTRPVVSVNNYHAFAYGSKLTIDNVALGYDPSVKASAPAKKSNKRR